MVVTSVPVITAVTKRAGGYVPKNDFRVISNVPYTRGKDASVFNITPPDCVVSFDPYGGVYTIFFTELIVPL